MQESVFFLFPVFIITPFNFLKKCCIRNMFFTNILSLKASYLYSHLPPIIYNAYNMPLLSFETN